MLQDVLVGLELNYNILKEKLKDKDYVYKTLHFFLKLTFWACIRN